MEALVGYESDDGDGKIAKSYQNMEPHKSSGAAANRRDNRADANYQKVNMDVSDESSDSSSSSSQSSRGSSKRRGSTSSLARRSEDRKRPSNASKYRDRSKERSRSRDRNAKNDVSRNRNFGGRDDRRNDRRDDRRDNHGRDAGRIWNNRDRRERNRDAVNNRDRREHFRDRGGNGRGNNNRGRFRDDDHSSFGRRKDNFNRRDSPPKKRNDYDRYSRDRDNDSSSHRRNDSPKKRDERSASPKPREPKDNHSHPSQTSHTSGSSASSETSNKPAPPRTFTSNDFLTRNQRRVNEKVQQLQKMGIEIPNVTTNPLPFPQPKPLMETMITAASVTEPTAAAVGSVLDLTNFTSPVLVNAKYMEQNQKKKLIWGSKKEQFEQATVSDVAAKPVTTNKWEMATFSQDSDGKVASKFLRLMGMKGDPLSKVASPTAEDSGDSNVKKREEMFSTMEQQYEVARQATHTMRGMGLGFGTQPRSF